MPRKKKKRIELATLRQLNILSDFGENPDDFVSFSRDEAARYISRLLNTPTLKQKNFMRDLGVPEDKVREADKTMASQVIKYLLAKQKIEKTEMPEDNDHAEFWEGV